MKIAGVSAQRDVHRTLDGLSRRRHPYHRGVNRLRLRMPYESQTRRLAARRDARPRPAHRLLRRCSPLSAGIVGFQRWARQHHVRWHQPELRAERHPWWFSENRRC